MTSKFIGGKVGNNINEKIDLEKTYASTVTEILLPSVIYPKPRKISFAPD